MAISRVTIGISGLGYKGAGADEVERALSRMPGVLRAYVYGTTEMAYVEYEPAAVSPENLVNAILSSGFEVETPNPIHRV